ncbi:transmembrane protein 231 isoform X1 [Wyeomyia smithii]|uniref:transmembrane protein 231 isoform X1 n=1 Tax=Wyeomyia smithii TaxID=174621 RepID=UPI002467C94B|nr:transmembrane protein 231 isoform X1 [Wyeomyia smithii]
MKLFNLHRKSVYILYRSNLCSFSTFVITSLVLLALALPYYVILIVNPGGLWDDYRLVYEQPAVKFTYRYLFLAEIDQPEIGNEVIACSSFNAFNTLTAERQQECTTLKVATGDRNEDGKIDSLSVSVSFNLPDESTGLVFYSFYFFLEAEIMNNCYFLIPAFISLNKITPPKRSFNSGTITHRGHLQSGQSASLQCPFFMRNIKTHFNHNYLPNENFTRLEEFLPDSIQARIEASNAAYFNFNPQRIDWEQDGSGEVTIRVKLLIGGEDSRQTALLYRASIWQKVLQLWIQYFSVLIVFLWIADLVKDRLFESFTIRAMEIVPWKVKND